ncbi:MAG: hypothetical protein M1837_000485 [Sclerophora amabilis]|nr:MAG: hypothetical protein M1837_000485 [Sclerophora amabilis]
MTMSSAELTSLIEDVTGLSALGAPGIVFHAVDRNGNTINSTASGIRGLNNANPMTMDTTFWIASCTKMITSIALMQLVEQDKADLDNPDQLEKVLPELKEVKIIDGVDADGKEQLREKKNRITLRMLQTHTAGFSYTFFNDKIWKRIGEDPMRDEFQCVSDAFEQPLVFEPGTSRAYGIGIDWVGIFIERVSGVVLGDYFQKYIFDPLEIKNIAFVPNANMRSTLASMHSRGDQGTLSAINHLLRPARQATGASIMHSGGGGLLGNAPEYCRVIAALLNDGVSPTTSSRILQKSTIDQMFTNQIPDWNEKWAAQGEAVCRPDLASIALRDGIPAAGNQGWGLNFLLMGDTLQRAEAPGLSNCFWALDREKGVGGMILSQILPFGDPAVVGLWMKVQELMFQDKNGPTGI